MIFYKHYIGDFQRDTGHLSLTERGAYLSLMHHYYATEQALPADVAALWRIAGAVTKAERDAVKAVMRFFELRDGQHWHKRIEAELEKQEGRSDTNRKIALDREARKRAEKLANDQHKNSTNRAPSVPRTDHENSTNQNQSQGIGIPPFVAKEQQSVCVENAHTHFSEEFRAAALTRPELDVPTVWAKFVEHYPAGKQTLARWKTWLQNEIAPKPDAMNSIANDPDSRSSVEAEAKAKGLKPWDEISEQWPAYKARVRSAKQLEAA